MMLEENWAVSQSRARAFFLEQPDVSVDKDGFLFEGCVITLTPAEGKPGPFSVPRTILRIEGEEMSVRTIYQRFFLRFLSAGG